MALTMGALRAALTRDVARTWDARADLPHDDPVPYGPRGGLPIMAYTEPLSLAALERLIALLPANPFVAWRRAEAGVLLVEDLPMAGLDWRRQVPWHTVSGEPQQPPEAEAGIREMAVESPPIVDWRWRWGRRWVTGHREQTEHGIAWAYAAAALVESMIRIEHRLWTVLSEADVIEGWSIQRAWLAEDAARPRGSRRRGGRALLVPGANPRAANAGEILEWVRTNGIADAGYVPRPPGPSRRGAPPPYSARAERLARAARVGAVHPIVGAAAMRRWLDLVGPLLAHFAPPDDFGAYGRGVYRPKGFSAPGEGHEVLIVGYSDDAKCWIVKNSWGSSWGEYGFAGVAYGECGIEDGVALGVTGTDPGLWARRQLHAGALFESVDGIVGRRRLVTVTGGPRPSRQTLGGAEGGWDWRVAEPFLDRRGGGADDSMLGYPALIRSGFDNACESVHWEFSGALRHRRFDPVARTWSDLGEMGPPDADGWPGLALVARGGVPQPHLVVRTADSRLAHWALDPQGWYEVDRFGARVLASGPALVDGGGQHGGLNLVCVLASGEMVHFSRDEDGLWQPGEVFGAGIGETPVCVIGCEYGRVTEADRGSLELVVASDGRAQHWSWDPYSCRWTPRTEFGTDIRHVWGLTYSGVGDLEVIAERADGATTHYWWDPAGWHDGGALPLETFLPTQVRRG